ncbi:MAG: prephenate dehydrogenase [Clostridium sp.]|uniref:prephenate dehydrogenase n=1 Tax=Clostridium sp. TaxID=1506 RepID=UPI002A8E2302|nr:prephenate dehydrogenase [Clostridium sp.]MDY5098907.1 prephenate dehydrogenase [Clostridium sp.]
MNIVIVGLGVIGGSYALALKDCGYTHVYGIDTNFETLKTAENKGIIKKGFTHGEDILGQCDLVILSIYPDSVTKFLTENKPFFKAGAIITDATGVKGVIVSDIEKILRDDIEFVFGHPMAGREKKGIAFADSNVFKGANYIITPTDRTSSYAASIVENLALDMGFKRVTRVHPEEHDALIAFTSQLPHIIAVALINSDDKKYETGKFIGDSYRELTRISNINGSLWTELFLNNKENLLRSIENFETQLHLLKNGLIANDENLLMELFKESSTRRENLE